LSLCCYDPPHRDLHSFPTRRSSDLTPKEPPHMSLPLIRETLMKRCRGTVVCASLLPAALLILGLGFADRGNTPFVVMSKTLQSRSEEHTSELQSQSNLVCRLLLEKK